MRQHGAQLRAIKDSQERQADEEGSGPTMTRGHESAAGQIRQPDFVRRSDGEIASEARNLLEDLRGVSAGEDGPEIGGVPAPLEPEGNASEQLDQVRAILDPVFEPATGDGYKAPQ
jgi:hypothetical protein